MRNYISKCNSQEKIQALVTLPSFSFTNCMSVRCPPLRAFRAKNWSAFAGGFGKCNLQMHPHTHTHTHMISQTGTRYVNLQALLFCCHSWISEPSTVAWYLQVSYGIWPQKHPRKENSHQPRHQHHPVAIPTPPIPETKNCKKIIDSPAAYMAWKFQFHFYSESSTRRHTVVKDLPEEGPQTKNSLKK